MANKQDRKLYKMQEDLKRSEHVHYTKNILGEEHYEGTDPRRRRELMDFNMIQEDHNAIANMPEQFINRPYKREPGYRGLRTTDTEGGI